MTKLELLKFLEPFDDEIEIKVVAEGDELAFEPEYYLREEAKILLRVY